MTLISHTSCNYIYSNTYLNGSMAHFTRKQCPLRIMVQTSFTLFFCVFKKCLYLVFTVETLRLTFTLKIAFQGLNFNSVVADSCLMVFRSLFWLCLNECRA